MKVHVEKELIRRREYRKIYVDGIQVCECEIGGDYYCTISKGGTPSNIRDKWKKTYSTRWLHDGIAKVLGPHYERADFKDDHADLKWGYQGSVVSLKKVKDLFNRVPAQPLREGPHPPKG